MDNDLFDSYKVLELEPGASPEETKRAYRDLVQIWHPDHYSHNSRLQQKAEEKLKKINAAYEYLRNYRPSTRPEGFRPSSPSGQSQQSSGSEKTRSGKPKEPPKPPPHKKRESKAITELLAGIWEKVFATLRYEYRLFPRSQLFPRVARIPLLALLILVVFVSLRNYSLPELSHINPKVPREIPSHRGVYDDFVHLIDSDDYKQSSPENQYAARKQFFEQNVATDTDFPILTPEDQQKVLQAILDPGLEILIKQYPELTSCPGLTDNVKNLIRALRLESSEIDWYIHQYTRQNCASRSPGRY